MRQIAPMTRNAWGGARAGAGRRARGPIASEPHKTRRSFVNAQVRIVARVTNGLSLRRGAERAAIGAAIEKAAQRHDFAVLSVVIRSKRLELVVAADHHVALARGMQGLQVSAAKRINAAVGRSGVVFPDRYRIVGTTASRRTTSARPAPSRPVVQQHVVNQGSPFASGRGAVLNSPRLKKGRDEQPTLGRIAWMAVTNPRRSWWL